MCCLRNLRGYTGGSGAVEDDRCRLSWKKGEDVKKWILRVETCAAACGWNNNKMVVMAAIGLPDHKVDLFLAVREENRADWPVLKKAILAGYKTYQASSEQAFLSRMRKPGQSFLLYFSVLELDYPDESFSNLAKKARRIGEVVARTQSSVERVAIVESTENTNKLDALCNELSELRHLLREQVNPESALDDVTLFLLNNRTQACQLAGVFLADLPRICKGSVVVPLLFG